MCERSITTSATKIIIVLLIVSLCVFTFLRIIESKDFILIVVMIVCFYFGQKTSVSDRIENLKSDLKREIIYEKKEEDKKKDIIKLT